MDQMGSTWVKIDAYCSNK